MKSAVLLATAAVAAAAVFGGCSKTPEPEIAELPSEPQTPSLQPPPAPAPQPQPVVAEAPREPRLAPEGTFFLLRQRSVETSDGILGLKPGTMVKRQPNGKYLAEGQTLELRPDEITNDLDIAAQAAGADARTQAALRQRTPQAQPPPPAPAATASAAPASTPPPPARTNAAPPPPPQRSALGTSSSLGSTHTMTRDGWLWQKDSNGNWQRVKPLR
jgi:hypothetical protein